MAQFLSEFQFVYMVQVHFIYANKWNDQGQCHKMTKGKGVWSKTITGSYGIYFYTSDQWFINS